MEITLEQIQDFNMCPMLYKFKHVMKIERGTPKENRQIELLYNDGIKKTMMFFFYQILNGRVPTQEQLRQKLGSIVYKDMNLSDLMARNTFDSNLNSVNMGAMRVLTDFQNKEANRKFVPIAVDTDVRIPVGENFVLMTLDLVREVQYKEKSVIEVVHFKTPSKDVDAFYVNHDLGLTASVYAFRKLFNTVENRAILHTIRLNKEYITVRKESEMRKFEANVNGVCDQIKRGAFWPVHNWMCARCYYKDVCDKYKF